MPATLLCGMIVAGVARAVIGRENVLASLGRCTRGDLLRAYVIAFFLPVCSIGVWPVPLTLRSMGVRAGPLVALASDNTMPGLLVPLIAIGAAVHLGTLVRGLRAISALRIAGVVTIVGLMCGVAIDVTLREPAYQPEDTHAFEDHGRLLHLRDHSDGPTAGFVHRLTRPLGFQAAWAGAGVLALVIVAATLALAIYTYDPPPAALSRKDDAGTDRPIEFIAAHNVLYVDSRFSRAPSFATTRRGPLAIPGISPTISEAYFARLLGRRFVAVVPADT